MNSLPAEITATLESYLDFQMPGLILGDSLQDWVLKGQRFFAPWEKVREPGFFSPSKLKKYRWIWITLEQDQVLWTRLLSAARQSASEEEGCDLWFTLPEPIRQPALESLCLQNGWVFQGVWTREDSTELGARQIVRATVSG